MLTLGCHLSASAGYLHMGQEAISIGADNIEFSTLPGVWNDHDKFIHLNKDDVLTLVNEHLNPYVEDRTADDLNIPD